MKEVVTTINAILVFWRGSSEWFRFKISKESNWRASLVPAAAVIPAPIVYCKVVVIKTLVVEWKQSGHDLRSLLHTVDSSIRLSWSKIKQCPTISERVELIPNSFTLIKSRCLKQNLLLTNDEAWYRIKTEQKEKRINGDGQPFEIYLFLFCLKQG